MGYKNANDVLPHELLRAIQTYIDGAYVYIPRKGDNKLSWGAKTGTKETLQARNREILTKHLAGNSVAELSEQFFLSEKSIYKILKSFNG